MSQKQNHQYNRRVSHARLSFVLLIALACLAPAHATDCFLLYDMNAGRDVVVMHPELAHKRFSPNSTFKVPVAVMAADQKLLDQTFRWNGKTSHFEDWNHDQTAASWLKYSVVWVTQQLTTQMGAATVQNYLDRWQYGNRDISGGLTHFWLMSSLRVSPREQVGFTTTLWRSTWPGMVAAKQILPTWKSDHGWVLAGKTGTGDLDDKRQQGWFVGHLQRGAAEYVVVLYHTDDAPPYTKTYAGPEARQRVIELLRQRGLW